MQHSTRLRSPVSPIKPTDQPNNTWKPPPHWVSGHRRRNPAIGQPRPTRISTAALQRRATTPRPPQAMLRAPHRQRRPPRQQSHRATQGADPTTKAHRRDKRKSRAIRATATVTPNKANHRRVSCRPPSYPALALTGSRITVTTATVIMGTAITATTATETNPINRPVSKRNRTIRHPVSKRRTSYHHPSHQPRPQNRPATARETAAGTGMGMAAATARVAASRSTTKRDHPKNRTRSQ